MSEVQTVDPFYEQSRKIRAMIEASPTELLPSFDPAPAFIEARASQDGELVMEHAEVELPEDVKARDEIVARPDKAVFKDDDGQFWVERRPVFYAPRCIASAG